MPPAYSPDYIWGYSRTLEFENGQKLNWQFMLEDIFFNERGTKEEVERAGARELAETADMYRAEGHIVVADRHSWRRMIVERHTTDTDQR